MYLIGIKNGFGYLYKLAQDMQWVMIVVGNYVQKTVPLQ